MFVVLWKSKGRIHYGRGCAGTPVYSSDGVEVGKVDEVVDNYREHILDGFVIEATDGELRFADAPEVARTAERAVRLNIDAAAVAAASAAGEGPPELQAAPRRAAAGKMLGGNWRRH